MRSHKAAQGKGIPVIRVYLYGDKYRDQIELRDGRHLKDILDYFREVQELHRLLGSVDSAVIDVGKLDVGESRDLLIMDNILVADLPGIVATHPRITTQHKDRLNEAREYFRPLMGAIKDPYVLKMQANEVKEKYAKQMFPRHGLKDDESLFNYIMGEVMSTSSLL
jgi:hypothetical protein